MIIEAIAGGERLRVKLTPLEKTAGVAAAEAQGDGALVALFEEQGTDFAERAGVSIDKLRADDPVASRHILRTVCDAETAERISIFTAEGNRFTEGQTVPLPQIREVPPDYPGFLHLVK